MGLGSTERQRFCRGLFSGVRQRDDVMLFLFLFAEGAGGRHEGNLDGIQPPYLITQHSSLLLTETSCRVLVSSTISLACSLMTTDAKQPDRGKVWMLHMCSLVESSQKFLEHLPIKSER